MSDDVISRQAVIRFIREKVNLSTFMKKSIDKADKACMELCEMIARELPSAERRGQWIIKTDVAFPHMVCSECKKPFYGNMNDVWNYCPHCGAKMDLEYEDA